MFGTETVDGTSRTVLQFPQENGVALSPTTGVIPNDHYTIVVLFRFADGLRWRRIVDFLNGSSDTGLYAGPADDLNFFNVASGTSGTIPAGTYVQVVLTRTTAGTVTGYVDGAQEFQFDDTGSLGVIDANNILRFFRDNDCTQACHEDSAGAVARIRLYDNALTPTQVARLKLLPPKPAATVTPSSGPPGSVVHVTGANFGPSETVKVVFIDGTTNAKTTLGTGTTDAPGSFGGDFTIPANASSGASKIKLTGATSKLMKAVTFTVS